MVVHSAAFFPSSAEPCLLAVSSPVSVVHGLAQQLSTANTTSSSTSRSSLDNDSVWLDDTSEREASQDILGTSVRAEQLLNSALVASSHGITR
jgi:hypothetical protein